MFFFFKILEQRRKSLAPGLAAREMRTGKLQCVFLFIPKFFFLFIPLKLSIFFYIENLTKILRENFSIFMKMFSNF